MLISHFFPNKFANKFTKYVEGHDFLSNFCTKEVDLIYCGSVSQLGKAMIMKEKFNKPLICWVWDIPYCWRDWCRTNDELRDNNWRGRYIENMILILKKCDKVISSSKYTQRILKNIFNIESEQMYFYIDTEKLDSVKVDGKKGHIIQISRFALNKRFDISIKAMNGIGRKLVCIGTGDYKKLENLAQQLKVEVDFYCNSEDKEKIKLLKESELLVSPSIFEGWGMTPIEALYCETPVLLNDLEVFRELYGDKVLYHKRDSSKDMREKLNILLNDKELQKKILKECQPLISEFTIPKFVKRWEKMIQV